MTAKEFRDPMLILESKEQNQQHQSCSACRHFSHLWGVVICTRHEGRVGKDVHLCSDFERRKNNQ